MNSLRGTKPMPSFNQEDKLPIQMMSSQRNHAATELVARKMYTTPAQAAAESASPRKRDEKCFITSACMVTKNLPDDCYELMTLRRFRDEYIMETDEGMRLVEEYYTIAPAIVTAIEHDTERDQLWEMIYKVVGACIRQIERNSPLSALEMYIHMVMGLKKRYAL